MSNQLTVIARLTAKPGENRGRPFRVVMESVAYRP